MLANYTYLTSGFTLQEPNVYADSNEQIVKGFSNMLWYVLIVNETLLFFLTTGTRQLTPDFRISDV